MSTDYVPATLRRLVIERAGSNCEYCRFPESCSLAAHEIDHITAQKHGGATEEANLALSCAICNQRKGTDIASIDPGSGAIVRLFHPRQDAWSEHFRLAGAVIESVTEVGRATVFLLRLNEPARLEERETLLRAGS